MLGIPITIFQLHLTDENTETDQSSGCSPLEDHRLRLNVATYCWAGCNSQSVISTKCASGPFIPLTGSDILRGFATQYLIGA